MVEWKVIVDPENTFSEDSSERDDNERDGKEETVFFDDDSYDVMVVSLRSSIKRVMTGSFSIGMIAMTGIHTP